MGFIITWLLITVTFMFVFSLFRPHLLTLLLPIKWCPKRIHNLAIFVVLFICGIVVLNFSMKTQAEADNSVTSKIAGDFDSSIKRIDAIEGEARESMIPDPSAQEGVNVPKIERKIAEPKKEETAKTVWGCTDPTASNYDPKATVNSGKCKNSSSD